MLNFLLLALLAAELHGGVQATSAANVGSLDVTFGIKNGRHWLHLSEAERPAYLGGIAEGWFLGLATQPAVLGKHLGAFQSGNSGPVTWGDLASFVTAAYSDRENINLPIAWVAAAGVASFRGETTRELVLPVLRRYLSLHWAATAHCRSSQLTRYESLAQSDSMTGMNRQQEFEQLVAVTIATLALPYEPVLGTAVEAPNEAGVWYITLHDKRRHPKRYLQARVESESYQIDNLREPVRAALSCLEQGE